MPRNDLATSFYVFDTPLRMVACKPPYVNVLVPHHQTLGGSVCVLKIEFECFRERAIETNGFQGIFLNGAI
ncbi:hypothetical protein V6N11_069588 [Hibiscus sabdariffa]|uniref:Uncharacterized protein n=1 Tax=Hibiscus sabdariffa TaxID=183260 RepID=A0ABR2Q366_9ROSI